VSAPILLDTCALIWLSNKAPLIGEAVSALEEARDDEDGLIVSPISAWEIGQLVSRGRLPLVVDPHAWFAEALDSGVVLAPMTPDVLIASSFLPGVRLRDPADRILAATARTYRYRLMTRDRPLLEYGRAGFIEVIAC
jgi:PIN domain nuclease of toxin-antitoxin system